MLNYVGELVRQESLTFSCAGRELPGSKHDVAPNCVCARLNGTRRRRCLTIHVHAHAAEIVTEARFEIRAHGVRKRFAVALGNLRGGTGVQIAVRMGRLRALCPERPL